MGKTNELNKSLECWSEQHLEGCFELIDKKSTSVFYDKPKIHLRRQRITRAHVVFWCKSVWSPPSCIAAGKEKWQRRKKSKNCCTGFYSAASTRSALLRRWVDNEKERNSKCVVVQHTRCHRHKMCERILSRLLGFS